MTPATPAKQPDCVGYLAVLRDPVFGFTGGLLVVSPTGRPLEFHCSTPLKTTRAQEILFGPTLTPHVCGELIAPTLLSAAKLKPRVLLVREQVAAPLDGKAPVLLLTKAESAEPDISQDEVRQVTETALTIGGVELQLLGSTPCPDAARTLLSELSQSIALDEPFERVVEAMREAQRLGSREAPDDLAA